MMRPAGMSDEDTDSETEFTVTPVTKARAVGHGQLAGQLSVAVAGSSTGTTTTPSANQLNAKQRRSQKYWAQVQANKQEDLQLKLPPVKDPKSNPEAEDYFRYAKQANMNLRSDLKEMEGVQNSDHIEAIHAWTLNDVSIIPNRPSRQDLETLGEPLSFYRGIPIFYIDVTKFDEMMKVIRNTSSNELALDVECNNSHSFLGMTALIQLGIRGAVFLIDPFTCFANIKQYLQPLIEDPKVLKLMFGMGNDCKQFQKDFGMHAIGVIDLQLIYNHFRTDGGKNLIALSKISNLLVENYKEVKTCTLADWRRRPLTPDMIIYAASDASLLFEIWDHFKLNVFQSKIQAGILESKLLLKKAYQKRTFAGVEEDLRKQKVQASDLPQNQYDLFGLLHQWRERYAAIIDEVPTSMVPSNVLLRICRLGLPVDESMLRNCGVPKEVLSHQTATLLRIMNGDGHNLFMRINTCKCHNCMLIGHAAVHCPFPPNKDRFKEWYKDHPDQKVHQNRRRKLNKRRNKLQAQKN